MTQKGEFRALTADQAMMNFSARAAAGRSNNTMPIMMSFETALVRVLAVIIKPARKLMRFVISTAF